MHPLADLPRLDRVLHAVVAAQVVSLALKRDLRKPLFAPLPAVDAGVAAGVAGDAPPPGRFQQLYGGSLALLEVLGDDAGAQTSTASGLSAVPKKPLTILNATATSAARSPIIESAKS